MYSNFEIAMSQTPNTLITKTWQTQSHQPTEKFISLMLISHIFALIIFCIIIVANNYSDIIIGNYFPEK